MIRLARNNHIQAALRARLTHHHLANLESTFAVTSAADRAKAAARKVEQKNDLPDELQKRKSRLRYLAKRRSEADQNAFLRLFVTLHVVEMPVEQVSQLEFMFTTVPNTEDIYNWAVGKKQTPQLYDNELMTLMKKYISKEKARRDGRN